MTDPFLVRALLAGLGLAVIAAPLGCFVVWRRMSYFGETVAQASLIGIALGLALNISLTASALVAALVMAGLLAVLARHRAVPLDAVMGLLAHAALALGVLATALVKGGTGDLTSYLFGDIFAVSPTDLGWIAGGGAIVLAALVWLWTPLLRLSVHEDLAAAEGVPVERTRAVFIVVLALVIAVAMKVVGILLAIAFLIMPAVAARPLAATPERMAVVAVAVAAASVVAGLGLSVTLDTPGGPSIVVVMAVLAVAAIAGGAARADAGA